MPKSHEIIEITTSIPQNPTTTGVLWDLPITMKVAWVVASIIGVYIIYEYDHLFIPVALISGPVFWAKNRVSEILANQKWESHMASEQWESEELRELMETLNQEQLRILKEWHSKDYSVYLMFLWKINEDRWKNSQVPFPIWGDPNIAPPRPKAIVSWIPVSEKNSDAFIDDFLKIPAVQELISPLCGDIKSSDVRELTLETWLSSDPKKVQGFTIVLKNGKKYVCVIVNEGLDFQEVSLPH